MLHARWMKLSALLGLAMLLSVALPAKAQSSGSLCFDNVPGITHCISDRFLEYWQSNGGLAQFGYPLTGEFEELTPEGRFTVQYFERQRFELHPENARPYDVLLGRIGAETLAANGRDWRNEPVPDSIPGDVCRRFDVTRHIVCGDFLIYWTFRKLNITSTTPANRSLSLQLFGLPLTEQQTETNPDGFNVPTQWFERARFEYYPDNPRPYQVLLGRLGAESLNGVQAQIGGELFSGTHPVGELRIESPRDGSTTTVRYAPTAPVTCQDGREAPADTLTRSGQRLIADGTFDSNGILTANRFIVPC